MPPTNLAIFNLYITLNLSIMDSMDVDDIEVDFETPPPFLESAIPDSPLTVCPFHPKLTPLI